MKNRVLLLGGLGFIGRHLSKELYNIGYDVIVSDIMHYDNTYYNYRRCDISNYLELRNLFNRFAFDDCDYVYNLAAEFGRLNGEEYYDKLWKTNVVGMKNIIKIQEDIGFKLIHFSSSEVYGNYSDIMREDIMLEKPILQLNDYAMSKWVNEQQIINSSDLFGTKTVRVRLFNIYGYDEPVNEYRSAVINFIYKAIRGYGYNIYKNHYRSNLYISDAVKTLSNIADNFIAGRVYNIASDTIMSVEDMSNIIIEEVSKKFVVKKSPVLLDYPQDKTTSIKKADISLAINELGHEVTVDFNCGVRNIVDWIAMYG
jgi:dTDP-glucose 4,6-dehydratase